jgi:glycosyltransferase involved in cell wall biosynthesis
MDNPSLRQTIEASGLFDGDWYNQHYPDVEKLGLSPSEHFMRIGARLLRDPGPDFSVYHYLSAYPDVAENGINPLLHYIRYGKTEGRKIAASSSLPLPLRCAKGAKDALKGFVLPGFERLKNEEIDQIRTTFDADYYLAKNQDVAKLGVDPLAHYMIKGWREGRDPTADFCTDYYLDQGPDIRKAGVNPFIHYITHGRRERRPSLPYRKRLDLLDYQPKVSVIVPNFNHGRFLEQRIESILQQTYRHFELLILDDGSTDNSREVIDDYCARYPDRIRSIINETNSGSVFRQWRKGVENSDGELIWICESDDFCEPNFLESLVRHFKDRSVNISFGRIQFSHHDGKLRQGLDQYREGAEPDIWGKPLVRPASKWFSNGFGVNNVIANVGGCIWRNQNLPESVWREAETYTILGDWFLYCHLAGGGQIAFEPEAIAYFRQHGNNTSVSSFTKPTYYEEHQRLMTLLRQRWQTPAETVEKFFGKVSSQYQHFKLPAELGNLDQYINKSRLLEVTRRQPHILIAFLGFHSGGGEVFPINLANALHQNGHLVSMLALNMEHANADMLAALEPGVAVYDASYVSEIGADAFLERAGVSLIHSHMVSLESFFFEKCKLQSAIPYLVTLHGSYEACGVAPERVLKFMEHVSHWVYTADKNIDIFRQLDCQVENFTKLENGMPLDSRPFPKSRAELGIDEDALVFTLVARGVQRKGWRAAIKAFIQLRHSNPQRSMHLLLCGDGVESERHAKEVGNDPDITFLGYQSCIHGLYRISDCAVVPTRFSGESFPLCIIQALQTGTPVIGTRIGEIENMVAPPGEEPGGLLIDCIRDTQVFIDELEKAMARMLDPSVVDRLGRAALSHSRRYGIENVVSNYQRMYTELLAQPCEGQSSRVDSNQHISQTHPCRS